MFGISTNNPFFERNGTEFAKYLAEAYGNRGRLKMNLGSIEYAKMDFQTALELAVDVDRRVQKLNSTE